MSAKKAKIVESVTIAEPNFQVVQLTVEGTAPYVQHKFSHKAQLQMMEKQAMGKKKDSRADRKPRDFEADFKEAQHLSEEGWNGIPASSFKNAMVSACRSAGFVMTKAKQGILFVEPDGFDPVEGTPLVKITGRVSKHRTYARNETGVADIRVRPMWKKWKANVVINYDADMFTASDVVNLMARAGMQVGIGEGRPDSKKSNGIGWGTFRITNEK